MKKTIAKIAVSAATYWIDKPYDYLVPQELLDSVEAGVRVTVPFSRGNRPTEGIVLTVYETDEQQKLKSITGVLDKAPVLSEEMVKLALWMNQRYFCTVYEAVKTMLPVGLWFDFSQTCRIAENVDKSQAYEAAGKSKKQIQLIDLLYANEGCCDLGEVVLAFGETNPSDALKALSEKGIILTDSVNVQRVSDKTISFANLSIPSEDALSTAAARKRSAPSQAAVLELLAAYGGASLRDISALTGASSATVKRLVEEDLVSLDKIEVFRRPDYKTAERAELPTLNAEQMSAFDGIFAMTKEDRAGAALLHGVTGSGKTAVYIRLIDQIQKQGRTAILLVPEIALTPQMLLTFSSHFGDSIAVMHSSLSVGERYDEWKRIRRGEATLVIGTRSAIFAPVSNLGLIIIDEEQEETYKSENAPRYHARDIAKYRCARSGATLLLGSATPNVESSYAAEIGKYKYFSLSARFNQMELPTVEIVDMKRELRQGNGGNLSSVLLKELSDNITDGKQSILFLNRRGMNKLISCGECGFTYKCPRCSVSLTYHSPNKRLMCHYCGYSQSVDQKCPDCGGTLNYVGAGTQKIEEELAEHFPDVPVIRMDTDTVSKSGSHDTLLSKFRDEKIPIMVGTQMVTKGLDFPNVTLVGVISADQSLYSGDYRASERTFSLITQVVGRSGRGETPGRAVIQTFTPQNQVILQAAKQDYDSFYRSELEIRRIQWCPPFSDLFCITATGTDENLVLRALLQAKNILKQQLRNYAGARILGPAPLPVVRVNNRYRYRLILACKDDKEIRELVSSIIVHCSKSSEFKGVSVFGDINPTQ